MGYINNDGMCVEGDVCWFIGREDRILYKMDLVSLMVEAVCVLEKDGISDFRVSQRCIVHENRVYCLPDQGRSIQIYDIKEKSLEKIPIDLCDDRLCILNAWIEESYLWCIAFGSSELLKIDLNTKSVVLKEKIFSGGENACGYESTKVGKLIFCVSREQPVVIEINTDTLVKKEYFFNINEKGFNTIAYDGSFFYLTGYSYHIYRWDKHANILLSNKFGETFITAVDEEKVEMHPIFKQTVILSNYIIFIPWIVQKCIGEELLVWDRQLNKYECIVFADSTLANKGGESFVLECIKDSQSIIVYDCNHRVMAQVNIFLKTTEKIGMKIDKSTIGALNISEDISLNDSVYENDERYNLKDLVHFLRMDIKQQTCQNDSSVGKEIWRTIHDVK